MRNFLLVIVFGLVALIFSGCASIVNNAPENFSITSDPNNAKVVVTDIRTGMVIIENRTPLNISLERKAGYFKGRSYRVVISKDGFKDISFSIKPTISGWYFGNLLFGGVIGMLIVDPLTGGMWNLEPIGVQAQDNVIGVKLLSETTQDERSKMVKIK